LGRIKVLQEEEVRTLTQIGFTRNQAKLYITLLNIGKSNGRTISEQSKVPRQEVYRVLDELQEMGLVEKVIALPCEFKAVSMREGLSILLKQKAKVYKEAEEKTEILLRKFEPNEENRHEEKECLFIVVPRKGVLINRIRNEHDNSQRSVDLVTTVRRLLQAIPHCFENYEKALERGVKYRVVTEKPKDEEAFLKNIEVLLAKPNFRLRNIRNHPGANVAIFDKKRALVAVFSEANLEESPVIWTNYASFLAIYQAYFENIWVAAQEKTQRTRAT
jgi:sugar-specific transcriptional regulator TrmB